MNKQEKLLIIHHQEAISTYIFTFSLLFSFLKTSNTFVLFYIMEGEI